MSNDSELVPINISDDEKAQMISLYVKANLLDVSQQVFDDYIKDNTGHLDSPVQKWTTAEAALGAAVVNDMVNKLLKKLVDSETVIPCQHEKLYSLSILTSNPPQYQWICELCGERGTTRVPAPGDSRFERVVEYYYQRNNEK